jgi:hypothetical protein
VGRQHSRVVAAQAAVAADLPRAPVSAALATRLSD